MLDHILFNVNDLEKSKAFYQAVLTSLGYQLIYEVNNSIGFGAGGNIDFCLQHEEPVTPGIHFAFRCDSKAEVRAFYEAAIKAGGTDNGPPGIRADYHPNYYGAFVIDINGHNIEAVCHNPE